MVLCLLFPWGKGDTEPSPVSSLAEEMKGLREVLPDL